VGIEGQIGPIARSQFGGGHAAGATPGGGAPAGGSEPRSTRIPLDDVVLTEPRFAALRLLRQRVLERTREALELPRTTAPAVVFADAPGPRADVFVGRLLSEQHLLAARRHDTWSEPRIAAALEEGITSGTAETLEVLHDVGRLDADTWGLLCGVLDEFHRKVDAAR
jgi:hypothetical protein